MIDGKLIDGGQKTVSLEAPSNPKQDVLMMSDDRSLGSDRARLEDLQSENCPITLGDPIPESQAEPELDLSLGDLNPSSATDDVTGEENKDGLTNNDDPKPTRKVTGKKRRMGRRRMPSGAE